MVQLKIPLMISQKCVAFVTSLLLVRVIARESVGLEKAFTCFNTNPTDLGLADRSSEPKVLEKPAAGLPDYHVWC